MRNNLPPSMSIAFLHPVLDAMKTLGWTEESLAEQLKTSVAGLNDPAVMLPAIRIYDFLEWASVQSGDQWLCARVGQNMARGGWAPINPIFRQSRTVWEFLRRFGVAAQDQGGAAVYRLEIEGHVAQWRLSRPAPPPASARYADAIAVGFFMEILRCACLDKFKPKDIIVVTSDESLLPYDLIPRASLVLGESGVLLRFPSDWLDHDLPPIDSDLELQKPELPGSFDKDLKARVKDILKQNLSNAKFGIDDVAEAIGIKKWKLQRSLNKDNTSVAKLRNEVRSMEASHLLGSTKLSVSEIAARLGYTNPSNFSRSFRAKTGKSPFEFRKQVTTDEGAP